MKVYRESPLFKKTLFFFIISTIALFIALLPLAFARADHGEETAATEEKTDTYSSIKNIFQSRTKATTETARDTVEQTNTIKDTFINKTSEVNSGNKNARDTIKETIDAKRANTGERALVTDEEKDELRKKTLRTQEEAEKRATDARAKIEEKKVNAEKRAEEARIKTEEKRADIEEKRAEKKRELTEKAKERITAYFERVMKRLSAALDRMEKLADRVSSRLDKLAEKGVDTTKAETLLAVAYDEIEKGRAAIAEAEIMSIDVAISDTPNEIFAQVKNLIRDVAEAVKNAHRALVDAIIATKASVGVKDTDTANESDASDVEEE